MYRGDILETSVAPSVRYKFKLQLQLQTFSKNTKHAFISVEILWKLFDYMGVISLEMYTCIH
jgi:hypothetical protein